MAILAGRYELERRLGGGGMAEVFLARLVGKDGFSRQVAIKRVLAHLATDESFAKMFVAEAQMCAKLQHPNIVSVLDFDRDDEGRPFLVIELVDGPSLAELADGGALPIGAAVHVATELLRGLAYAHELPGAGSDGVRGIVHRDISPHNVLLSWEGAVKLSDFGIAKARDASGVTASELLKGKPAYMSPEQANGEALDGRSDLFAVGILLWELLVGRALFSGNTTQETLARVLFAPVPSPRSIRAEVPEDVDAVVMKLLAREKTDRYADANDAIAALVACKDHPRDGREKLVALLADRFADDAPQRRRMIADVPTVRTPAEYAPTLPAPRDAARARTRPWMLVLGAITLTSIAVAVTTVVVVTRRGPDASTAPTVNGASAAVDQRAMERSAIAKKMVASGLQRAPFSFPNSRLFEPTKFYVASMREAERLLGEVSPTVIVWNEINERGTVDSTLGGSARHVFVGAIQPDGFRCVELGIEDGAAYIRVLSDCRDTPISAPGCTAIELRRRATAAGLTPDSGLSAVLADDGRWLLTGEGISTTSENDCTRESIETGEESRDASVDSTSRVTVDAAPSQVNARYSQLVTAMESGTSRTPFSFPASSPFDPLTFFTKAHKEARRILGAVNVGAMNWRGIGEDGRVSLASGGSVQHIFMASKPTAEGVRCVEFWADRDGAWLRLSKGGRCDENGGVPRCSGKHLYDRAILAGLPRGSTFDATVWRRWQLVADNFLNYSANDCGD